MGTFIFLKSLTSLHRSFYCFFRRKKLLCREGYFFTLVGPGSGRGGRAGWVGWGEWGWGKRSRERPVSAPPTRQRCAVVSLHPHRTRPLESGPGLGACVQGHLRQGQALSLAGRHGTRKSRTCDRKSRTCDPRKSRTCDPKSKTSEGCSGSEVVEQSSPLSLPRSSSPSPRQQPGPKPHPGSRASWGQVTGGLCPGWFAHCP